MPRIVQPARPANESVVKPLTYDRVDEMTNSQDAADLGDSIRVGPARGGYVRVSKMSSFEESQRRWPRLRKVLARFGAAQEPWRDRAGTYGVDGERFIDIALEADKRPILVADLEAAGFDVIDDVGTASALPRHPYRVGRGSVVGEAAQPLTYDQVDELTKSSEAADMAAEATDSPGDEVEFGCVGSRVYAGGNLSGLLTHQWNGRAWTPLAKPIQLAEGMRTLTSLFEAAEGYDEMSYDEFCEMVASRPGTDVFSNDVMDPNSGEVYAEKGQKFSEISCHPDYTYKRPSWMGDASDDDVEDVEDDEDDEDEMGNDSRQQYEAALEEFVSNVGGVGADFPDVDPQDIAVDLAQGFFHTYSDWKIWARDLDMSKSEMLSAVADFVHDRLTST